MKNLSKLSKPTKNVLKLNAACAAVIFIYGYLRCYFHWKSNDPIKAVNVAGTNGWSVSHFVFNAVQGYLFPDQWLLCFALGVAWELLEFYLYHVPPSTKWLPCSLSDGERWVYPDAMDIFYNALGLAVGVALRKSQK